MINWFVDEGLSTLIKEWKKERPNAIVYTIGDSSHSSNPDKTQHAPDRGGSKPGDDKGEVDAADFMPGKGVTQLNLEEMAEGLRLSRDKRLLIVIYEKRIFSSYPVGRYNAFEWRPYSGTFHGHVHVSVNDNFDNDQSDWKWEKMAEKSMKYIEFTSKLPEKLSFGDDDDAYDNWNHVMRAQALLNLQNKAGLPRLDFDGVYGAKTVQMVKSIFGGDGKTLTHANLKTLHGLS